MLVTKLSTLESPIISEKLIMSNAAYLTSKELKELKHIATKKDLGMPLLETGVNLVDLSTVITLMKMLVEVDGNLPIISRDQFWLKDTSFKLLTIVQIEIQSVGKLPINKET